MTKPPLTILLGAGSTADLGLPGKPRGMPGTRDITEALRNMRLPAAIKSGIPVRNWEGDDPLARSVAEIPILGHIFKRLDASYKPANVNFELLLHALEQLDPYVFAKTSHDIDDEYRPVLYAFTRMKRRSEFLQDIGFLTDLRRRVVNRILEIFLSHESSLGSGAARATRELIFKLEEHFAISVFTLNYDDIIDRARETWFDGFDDPIADGPQDTGRRAWKFDALRFARWKEQNIQLLAHLHGSVRYGHSASSMSHGGHDLGALVKFDNAQDAFNTLVGIAQGDRVSSGRIISSTSIISGLSKLEKLMSTPSPYAYYYMALIAALSHASRLLIVGYGGADAHMNTWLREFTRSHRGNHKAVYVGKLSPDTAFEPTPVRSLMSGLAGGANVENVSEEPGAGHFHIRGSLGIVVSGFPMSDVTLDKAIQFLKL